MQKTRIEWVRNPDGSQGYSWNPIKGLCPVGCWYCYAKSIYKRFYKEYLNRPHYDYHWKNIQVRQSQWRVIGSLENAKKPRGIFLCSTFELFHPITAEKTIFDKRTTWRDAIFTTIKDSPQHRFYILTKFPQNIDRPMPANVFLGVSVTGPMDLWRVDALKSAKANLKFISMEPMLENLTITDAEMMKFADWVILGKLTQHGKRYDPCSTYLACLVHALSVKNKTPIFMKDNLRSIWGEGNLIQELPKC